MGIAGLSGPGPCGVWWAHSGLSKDLVTTFKEFSQPRDAGGEVKNLGLDMESTHRAFSRLIIQ